MIVLMKTWWTIEIQGHLNDFLDSKKWIKFDNDILRENKRQLAFYSDFTEEDKNEIIKIIQNNNLILPNAFLKEVLWININTRNTEIIKDDTLYNITRNTKNPEIIKKIEALQRVLYDISSWKLAKKELDILIKK